jgi:hypothetical protein
MSSPCMLFLFVLSFKVANLSDLIEKLNKNRCLRENITCKIMPLSICQFHALVFVFHCSARTQFKCHQMSFLKLKESVGIHTRIKI